ncbi:hypothetical protein GCM10007392_36450 [Saccharospirillum salsuginis]|uniref:Uncharacterized protein n=1 Tax=Saccharospirillum salsuginis TaxID=418750 RepID=A0A918NDW7_9GAMM|nr:hypothetical protein GCM10007392_36450 [Saccharospirillum salsuginis]
MGGIPRDPDQAYPPAGAGFATEPNRTTRDPPAPIGYTPRIPLSTSITSCHNQPVAGRHLPITRRNQAVFAVRGIRYGPIVGVGRIP